jgi:two-component system sensor histidine kinase EvgS
LVRLTPANGYQQLRELAHRIKGAARIIRAGRVIEACDAMEGIDEEVTTEDDVRMRQNALEVAMVDLGTALRGTLGAMA